MLIRPDLGFLYPYLAISVLVVVSVIGFVIRRKWQLSAVRSEEVRRLVVLAADETARVEYEAYASAYVAPFEAPDCSFPPPMYHQCAVCFNPSTTRCSRCKAVRYCSGKCQIIHWREGHKHACQPFTTSYQKNYAGETPNQKFSEHENDIHGSDGDNTKSVGEPEDFRKDNDGDGEVKHLRDSVEKDTSFHVSSRSDKSESANGATCSVKPNDVESDSTRITTTTTSFSGSSTDGSTDSSFSEPSTPSSGFWDGTLNTKKTKHGAREDVGNTEKHTSLYSKKNDFNFSLNNLPPLDGRNSSPKIVAPKDAHEKIEDPLGSKGSPSSVPKNSDRVSSVRLSNDYPVFKARDPQSCTPGASPKSNRLAPVSSERSNGKVAKAHVSNGLKTSTFKVVDNLKVSTQLHSAAGVEVAGRYTNKGLFSYDAFVKLYNWNKVDMRPWGLTNCGNSCYANAVLQCLAWTPPLTAYLLQGLHSKACAKKEWCFTCEFESLLMKAREGTSPLSPSRILSEIQRIGSRLGNGREEDAHEFLRYAIDNMQSVCLKEARVSEPNSLEEETTLIGLTFGGYLRSKIKCTRCGGKSERHERMMDLTVEIEGDIETLEAALKKFTSTEVLDGENKYQCSRCKSYERAKKKLKIQEAPNVLTIALKRFQSGKFGKLNKSIRFPDILDLAPYMSGTSDKSPIYKLYGVVVHLDVMNATFSGHYVCYVKNFQNKWFKVDDSVVTGVERADVLSKRAYMLLYARCSPRAPRLIRNSTPPSELKKPQNPLVKLRSLSKNPWDYTLNGHTHCSYPNHSTFHHYRRILEDDSSSENSSSLFSEACSCSTESSNRDSSSTDEYFDRLFGDADQNWNTDASSSTSSSSSSPTSSYRESRFRVTTVSSLNSCKLDSSNGRSSSSSVIGKDDAEKVGLANILGSDKSGLSYRRSTRERGD